MTKHPSQVDTVQRAERWRHDADHDADRRQVQFARANSKKKCNFSNVLCLSFRIMNRRSREFSVSSDYFLG